MKPIWMLALSVGLGTPLAQAQTPSLADQLAQCRQIADGNQRLACFDAIAGPPVASGQWGAPAPGVAAAKPATAGAAAPALAGDQAFGLRDAGVSSVQSRIQGEFSGWKPRQRIRLINGQLWEVTDGSSGHYLTMHQPQVKIIKGVFSGFYMDIEGVNQRITVKRIE